MSRSFTDFIAIIKGGDIWQILLLLLISFIFCYGVKAIIVDFKYWLLEDILLFEIYLYIEQQIKIRRGE